MKHVFVYGTLKAGFPNHYLLEGARVVMPYIVRLNGFTMHSTGWYPVAVRGDGAISGEVYEINDAILASLDRLEGNGRLYQRELVKVETLAGVLDAWIYVFLHSVRNFQPVGGEWLLSDQRPWR